MKVVVTGGAGFIGSHIAEAALLDGHTVLVLDDLSGGKEKNIPAGAELERLDICDPRVAQRLTQFKPDAIFHHAAQMDVRKSVEDPVFDARVNVLGTVRLLEAASESGCAFFQLASTGGAIYGDQENLPTPEETAPRSASPYGLSKLCAEHYVDYFSRTGGMRGVSLRYGNVYGPRQDPHGEAGVVAIFGRKMLRGEAPTIFGDGEQTRDYVYVKDVVRAAMAAWKRTEATGPFNIGTGVETNVNQLGALIAKAAKFAGEIAHGAGKPGEQRRSCIAIDKAAMVLGWKPEVDLETGLAETIRWFSENQD